MSEPQGFGPPHGALMYRKKEHLGRVFGRGTSAIGLNSATEMFYFCKTTFFPYLFILKLERTFRTKRSGLPIVYGLQIFTGQQRRQAFCNGLVQYSTLLQK